MAGDKDVDKPMGVRLLAILSMVVGFLILMAGILFLVSVPFLVPENIQIAGAVVVLAILIMLLAIPFLVIGIGMWRLRGWARSIFFILAIVIIVMDPLRLALLASSLADKQWNINASEMRDLIVFLLSIVLSIFILWYLSRSNVGSAFESSEMAATKRKIRKLEERIELARLMSHKGEITKSELAKIRSDCLEKERSLKSRIRRLEKLRLSRERKVKEKAQKKEEARKERKAKREEKKAKKEEERAEKKAEREEKEKEAEEGEEEETGEEEAEKGKKGKIAGKKAKKGEEEKEAKEGEEEKGGEESEKEKKGKKTGEKDKEVEEEEEDEE